MIPFRKYKLAIGMIGLLILLFVSSVAHDVIKSEKKRKIYHEVNNLDGVNGTILYKDIDRTTCTIVLNNNRKYRLFWADNYNYNPYQLSEFLQIGDSIFKNENSDTLYIYRNNSQFFFRLSKKIGN
jgi:hypothetical protein